MSPYELSVFKTLVGVTFSAISASKAVFIAVTVLEVNAVSTQPWTSLTKAIQEQQTQIDALQSEINLLKGE